MDQTSLENIEFLGSVYDFSVLIWAIVLFALVDLALKGWALWRAAKMDMKGWFIALLVVNSMGIFPLLFITYTKKRYQAVKSATNPPLTKPENPGTL